MTAVSRSLLLAAGLAALACATPALAAGSDEATLRNYVLTSDKFHRYAGLMQALKKASNDPSLKAGFAGGDDSGTDQTISQAAARLRRNPTADGYIRRAGLTEEDAIIIPLVIVSASLAEKLPADKRGEEPIAPATYAFVHTHKAEIEAAMGSLH